MAVEDEIRGGAVVEPKTRMFADQVCENAFPDVCGGSRCLSLSLSLSSPHFVSALSIPLVTLLFPNLSLTVSGFDSCLSANVLKLWSSEFSVCIGALEWCEWGWMWGPALCSCGESSSHFGWMSCWACRGYVLKCDWSSIQVTRSWAWSWAVCCLVPWCVQVPPQSCPFHAQTLFPSL